MYALIYLVGNSSLRRGVTFLSCTFNCPDSIADLRVGMDFGSCACVGELSDFDDLEAELVAEDSSLILSNEEPPSVETAADLLSVLNPDMSVCDGVSGMHDVLNVIELLFLGVLVLGAG